MENAGILYWSMGYCGWRCHERNSGPAAVDEGRSRQLAGAVGAEETVG